MIAFRLDGEPVSTARPRVTRHGNTYTPKASLAAQASVAAAFRNAHRTHRPDPETRWSLRVVFHLGNRRRRDLDNLIKTVMDGLTGHLYDDDSQVAEIHAATILTSKHGAHTQVWAVPLTGA